LPEPGDEALLRRTIALARRSRQEGSHPFAALIVEAGGAVLAEALNAHRASPLEHAEMNALRTALTKGGVTDLARATLYSSAEPCAMCAGGIYWSGIGRVVYGLSERRLLEITGANPANPTLSLPCREVFAKGQRTIEVIGPLLEDEAAEVHRGFWAPDFGACTAR
jgi:tRNA(Arg) A34 adenosine deaminase TadA